MKCIMRVFLVVLLALSMLAAASCSKYVAEIADNAGIGRDQVLEMKAQNPDEGSDEEPEIKDNDQEPEKNEKVWEFVNGKYIYHFSKRDDSGLKDLSDIEGLYGVALDDQPDDWYFGKSTYDESTGEVTYVWDRSQSTIDTVEKYGAIYRGDTTRKVCYFTFDCGYEYGPTSSILDTLKEKQVSGIFFLTGTYVKSEHALMERMINEGHIIGNHTASHPHCNQLTAQQFIDELDELEDMFIEQFPDAQPMVFFRPPYGNCNEYILALTQKMGYHTVMWSYTYMDYDTENQLSYNEAMDKLKSGLHPGCVYLFHTESITNAAILGDFIDWVRAQGYEILPIADLLQEN